MRAGLYARVSREEQAEGYSIEEQLEAMRRFCRERGWTIVAEYVEPGYSGTVMERPVFTQVLADCEAGKLDILLTHQLDRFYRNLQLQLETLGQLGKWGVGYLSVTEQIDYSTPQGMLFLSMLGAFNEYYVANLRRETKKGKRGRAKKGLNNASQPAYGYVRDEESGKDVIDPKAAEVVITAFESYASGLYSDIGIARLLNRKGYKPSGRARSGKWTREGVRYMLTNPFYIGMVRHGDDLYPGQHEPIISEELWDRVQALRAKRGKNKGAGRRPDRVYLLSRTATCHLCGLHLMAQTSVRRGKAPIAYYSCPSYRRSVECPTRGVFVQASILEEQIAVIVKQLTLPDDWRERLKELVSHKEEAASIERQKRYLQGKLRRLHELYLEGDIEKQEYAYRKAEWQAQLAALRDPTSPEIERAGETLEGIGAAWLMAPRQYQRDMLRLIFEDIRVDVLGERIVSVKPHPPFVPLFRMDGLEEGEDGYFYPKD